MPLLRRRNSECPFVGVREVGRRSETAFERHGQDGIDHASMYHAVRVCAPWEMSGSIMATSYLRTSAGSLGQTMLNQRHRGDFFDCDK